MLKLYKAIIRPHLEYCPFVWDPPTFALRKQVESVQKSALRVCLKAWALPYSEMLSISTLESRRLVFKCCLVYKILNHEIYFPNNMYSPRTTRTSSRLSHPLTLQPVYAHTNFFLLSTIPHSITLWNSLPSHVVNSPSLVALRHALHSLLIIDL
jgi:hypothetical protein